MYKRHEQFSDGGTLVLDDKRPGHLTFIMTFEIAELVKELIYMDRRLMVQNIVEELSQHPTTVFRIQTN